MSECKINKSPDFHYCCCSLVKIMSWLGGIQSVLTNILWALVSIITAIIGTVPLCHINILFWNFKIVYDSLGMFLRNLESHLLVFVMPVFPQVIALRLHNQFQSNCVVDHTQNLSSHFWAFWKILMKLYMWHVY